MTIASPFVAVHVVRLTTRWASWGRIMTARRAAVVLALSAAVSHGHAETTPVQADRLDKFLSYGDRLCEKNLPRLKVVATESVENRHDPEQTDERRVLRGRGMECHVYVADVKSPRQFVFEAALESSKERMPFGLRFGASKAQVLSLFGAPNEARDRLLHYSVPTDLEDADLQFGFARDGKLSKIEWRWPYE